MAGRIITPETDPHLFIPGTSYLKPIIDVIFKILMTRNPEALKSLLNAVLRPKIPVESVRVLNPNIQPRSLTAKSVRLDVHATLQNEAEVDIEMQTSSDNHFARRAIYYTSQLAANSLDKGENYEDLPDVCGIFIFAKQQFPDASDAHTSYELARNIPPDGRLLSPGLFRLDFLELPKVNASLHNENRLLWIWAQFLAGNFCEEVLKAVQDVPELVSLLKDLQTVSDIMSNRHLAAKRRADARIAELSMKGAIKKERAEARAEGHAEAKAEARAERKQMAQNMLNEGLPRATVCRCLSITESELTALLASSEPTTNK
jgi:predicted transposase/invertase (TIGR01784 family)